MNGGRCTRRALVAGGSALLALAGCATLGAGHGYEYLAYVPDDYDADPSKKWPLLLFLHGAGERGSDLELVKVHGPPKLVAADRKFPFVVVSPQCPRGVPWSPPALEALIGGIQRKYRIDDSRIYLTGLSMGGHATWQLAARHPDRYAAIIPVCGRGDPSEAPRLRDLPVWAFHGALDDVVPLSGSRNMIDAIKAAGGNPRFTIYPAAGHDSWTETYSNDEIYSWLMQQRRP